jgi:hypothetical protein
MESLLNKPTYKYHIDTMSKVTYNDRTNCCFISSFQIQMKKQWDDFVSLDDLLTWFYPNISNAYTHFAYDFPEKWIELKKIMESKNPIWKERMEHVVLGIYLPLTIKSECVLLTLVDPNQIIPSEVRQGKYDSLEKSFLEVVPDNKISINVIQLYNHFEPVELDKQIGSLNDTELVANKDFFN